MDLSCRRRAADAIGEGRFRAKAARPQLGILSIKMIHGADKGLTQAAAGFTQEGA